MQEHVATLFFILQFVGNNPCQGKEILRDGKRVAIVLVVCGKNRIADALYQQARNIVELARPQDTGTFHIANIGGKSFLGHIHGNGNLGSPTTPPA